MLVGSNVIAMLCMHQSLFVLLGEVARNVGGWKAELVKLYAIRFNHSIFNMFRGLIGILADFRLREGMILFVLKFYTPFTLVLTALVILR